ncbi:MAG: hypothetical protein QM530_02375 [Phycisphaerales bacterium]|nr:hypothetical protein [Phycisphaerales bacterium]
MKGKNILGKLSLIALCALATTQSCKKEDGIDNNNIIQRPYVVYAADEAGRVIKTNEGINYKTIFPGDGTPLRAIVTSKTNILIFKDKNMFFSDDQGLSFNPYLNHSTPLTIKWPYFILSVESTDRIYTASTLAGSSCGNMAYSHWDNGRSFDADTNWKNDTAFSIESLTQLDNGVIYGYSLTGSKNGISKLFYKLGKDEPFMPRKTDLTTPYNFYLSHYNNTLVATDYDGAKGVWYSSDSGKTFKQYTGVPSVTLYATYGKYDQLFVGTDKMGIYRLEGTAFVSSNSGIEFGTTVYSIVGKDNYYKNNVTKKFFYIGTSTGIYRSEDLGKSWIKVSKDNLKYTLVF